MLKRKDANDLLFLKQISLCWWLVILSIQNVDCEIAALDFFAVNASATSCCEVASLANVTFGVTPMLE